MSDIPTETKEKKQQITWLEELKNKPQLLLAPDILHQIKTNFLDKDIIGEDTNKLLLFIIALTSLTNKPLGGIITGESSAGKSHIAKKVLKHFGNVEEFSRMTEASPDRMGGNFTNKILYISELKGVDESQSKLRILISEGKLRLLSCDMEGGGSTTVIETTGVPSFITTTTSLSPDTELLNRLFMLSIDETESQTKKVLKFEAQQFMDIYDVDYAQRNNESELVSIMSHLNVKEYRIPFADILARLFPARSLKARRDFKKLLNIIGTVAFLHQYQRPIVKQIKNPINSYILATPADFYIAFRIAGASLQTTLMNIQQRALETLAIFTEGDSFTAGEVSVRIDKTQSTTRQILNSLMHSGFLLRDDSKKPYHFIIKEGTSAFTCSVANFEEVFVSFGETELDNFLTTNLLYALHRGIASEVIDPITGETVILSELRRQDFENMTDKPTQIPAIEDPSLPSGAYHKSVVTPVTASKSVDEYLTDSKSPTEDALIVPTSIPKKIIWGAETNNKLRNGLFDTWSKESYYGVMANLGFALDEAERIFKRMKDDGQIFAIDFDNSEWRWV